jgi:hypothetical protein
MAREAQDHEIRLGVVPALKDPDDVVDVELTVRAGNSADLAA